MKIKLFVFAIILTMSMFNMPQSPQVANFKAAVLSVDDPDLMNLMPDDNFRQAVVDSINDSGWTPTSSGAEIILNEYPGSIDAKNKQIKSIEGIAELIHAEEINLSANMIKDFTPIYVGDKHYGYPGNISGSDHWNLYLVIDKNPIEKLPATFGGRIDLKQPGTSSFTYQFDNTKDIYSFIRTSGSQRFNLTIDIGRCKGEDGNYVALLPNTLGLLKMSDDPENPNIKPLTIPHKLLTASEAPSGEPNRYAKISELLLNQELKIGIGTDEILKYETADEYDTITTGAQSFKYYQDFKTRIYDRVKLLHNDKGSVSLLKTDKKTGLPLEGVEYDLYKGDTLYKSGLKTNIDGQIIVRDLEQGTYSFKETKTLEGYKLDESPIIAVVKDPIAASGRISGGVIDTIGATVTASDGTVSTPLVADEVLIAGSDTADIDLAITGGPYSVIVDYSALAMSRQPGKMDPEEIIRIFNNADEAKADINDMKNAGRIAGPVTVTVQYAPNVDVTQANEKIPTVPPKDPNTGDNTQLVIWWLVAILSGCLVSIELFNRSREKL